TLQKIPYLLVVGHNIAKRTAIAHCEERPRPDCNFSTMSQIAVQSRLTFRDDPSVRGDAMQTTSPFEEHRSLLFAMAYNMLGSAMEAEDIVQEAYLRYRATPPESIRRLKSFLMTVVHHLCLDHMKS